MCSAWLEWKLKIGHPCCKAQSNTTLYFEKFGFGSLFVKLPKPCLMYSIKLQRGTSPWLKLLCHTWLSYLFLIYAQLHSSPLKGITIEENEIIISQLADDAALFLKDATQVSAAIDRIKISSNDTGLCLTISKCVKVMSEGENYNQAAARTNSLFNGQGL